MTLKRLKSLCLILVFGAVMLFGWGLSGCYAAVTGKVVDAQTGEPIEGAVVLVEWTITKGLGFKSEDSYKVVEAVTDKEGRISISGVLNPLVNRPMVTAYKKGYVAWNNKFIFPDYKHRKDFKYKKGLLIKLERFKEGYSHFAHVSFIRTCVRDTSNIEEKEIITSAYRWEELLAQQEILIKKGLRP